MNVPLTQMIGGKATSPPDFRKLAILGYHKIGVASPGGWETWYYVPEPVFVRQLGVLHDRGFQVIDGAGLKRAIDGSEDLPDRAALLTFDDGYRSVLEVALPWLVRFQFPAIAFVPTGFIGGSNRFDGGAEPVEAICDWDELRELDRNRVSIQSHGVSHRSFSELLPAEQDEEVRESKRVLEDGLNRPVTLFAYPYGDIGTEPGRGPRQLRDAGYCAACLYDGRLNHGPIGQPFGLSRLTMGPDTDLERLLGQ